jgi:hypothetical protein
MTPQAALRMYRHDAHLIVAEDLDDLERQVSELAVAGDGLAKADADQKAKVKVRGGTLKIANPDGDKTIDAILLVLEQLGLLPRVEPEYRELWEGETVFMVDEKGERVPRDVREWLALLGAGKVAERVDGHWLAKAKD